jgi:hypothetical protein
MLAVIGKASKMGKSITKKTRTNFFLFLIKCQAIGISSISGALKTREKNSKLACELKESKQQNKFADLERTTFAQEKVPTIEAQPIFDKKVSNQGKIEQDKAVTEMIPIETISKASQAFVAETKQKLDEPVKKALVEELTRSTPIASQPVQADVLKTVEGNLTQMPNEIKVAQTEIEQKPKVEQSKNKTPIINKEIEAPPKTIDTNKMVQNQMNITTNVEVPNLKSNIENK